MKGKSFLVLMILWLENFASNNGYFIGMVVLYAVVIGPVLWWRWK